MKAAKAFFRSAGATMGFRPEWVATDGPGSYPLAIRKMPGKAVRHHTSAYLNRLKQDHRGVTRWTQAPARMPAYSCK